MNHCRDVRGIVPPLATPLTADRRLDPAGLERLVAHVTSGGVSGLFVLGTTGEGPHLDPQVKSEVVRRVCAMSSVPVLVGLCDPSTIASMRLAEEAAEAGASALVLTPPFYFPLSQAELLDYFRRVVPRLPLPVFLYNIPGMTKIRIHPETVRRGHEDTGMAGLKDSSGDMAYFDSVRRHLPKRTGFRLFCGPEEKLLEAVRLGADGGVCGGANLFPRLYVDLFAHAIAGRTCEAERMQRQILQLSAAVYNQTPEATSYLQGLKSALAVLGLCGDFLAEPLSPLDRPKREAIRRFLQMFEPASSLLQRTVL